MKNMTQTIHSFKNLLIITLKGYRDNKLCHATHHYHTLILIGVVQILPFLFISSSMMVFFDFTSVQGGNI
jgi:hypothetical protein